MSKVPQAQARPGQSSAPSPPAVDALCQARLGHCPQPRDMGGFDSYMFQAQHRCHTPICVCCFSGQSSACGCPRQHRRSTGAIPRAWGSKRAHSTENKVCQHVVVWPNSSDSCQFESLPRCRFPAEAQVQHHNLPLFLCLLSASRVKAIPGIALAMPLSQLCEGIVVLPRWLSDGEMKS